MLFTIKQRQVAFAIQRWWSHQKADEFIRADDDCQGRVGSDKFVDVAAAFIAVSRVDGSDISSSSPSGDDGVTRCYSATLTDCCDNNYAEFAAIYHALCFACTVAHQFSHICLFTDSAFAAAFYKCHATASGFPDVVDSTLECVLSCCQSFSISVFHVSAHVGDLFNEVADTLCRERLRLAYRSFDATFGSMCRRDYGDESV